MVRALALVLLSWLLTAGPAAYEPTLDLRAIDDAIAIGQARNQAVRARFHQSYRVPLGRPPFDHLDLVTPFRRVVLIAEERARLGDRLFRQRDAIAALAEHGTALQVFVELTFHPLNTYVGVPLYVVTLVPAGADSRIAPTDVQRVPRFTPRLGGTSLPYPAGPTLPSGGQPLVGGVVIATFDGGALDPRGVYDVVVEESGKELVGTRVDLATLR